MLTSSITSLVVESDPQRAEQILETLKKSDRYDFLCYHAENLLDAKRTLVSAKVDLVISKGVMEEVAHLDILARYRKSEYEPLVLCLLEDEEKSVILDTADSTADDYLFYKDLSDDRLIEAVQHAFERRDLLSELKSVQQSTSVDGKGIFRGLLHCLDIALFLVSRTNGELLFNNKVAEAWFPDGVNDTVRELFEYAVLEADSVELEIQTESSAVPNAELRSVAVEWKGRDCSLITLRNISKRKRAEEAYKASQRRLDLTLKASNIGLWSWDLRSNQLHFSDRWKKQLGYNSSEFPNTMDAFKSHLFVDDVEEVEEIFGQALRGEISEIELKYRMRHKNGGYRWVLCRAEIFPDNHGKLSSLLGSHIDITDRSPVVGKSGLETSLSEKLGIRMERIAAELETRASQIRTNFRGDSAIVERIHELERLSSSFACMNEVLQLEAGKGNQALEALALEAEVRALYASQRSLLPPRVELDVEALGDIRLYGLSKRGLTFALTEALVCVSEHVTKDFKSRIHLTIERGSKPSEDENCPVLRYRYTGESVGKAELLALSRTPHVRVWTEVEGAFSVLSIAFGCEVSKPKASNVQNKPPLVLLAEDEGVLRLAIRTMLESLGYDVVLAEDGAEAIDAFARRNSEFDLALVDLQMPEIDGYGVVATIRAAVEDLPIVRMSGDSSDELSGLLDDSDDHSCFLSKPFGISDLKLAIESLRIRVRA
ncbi:response regulator [Pelagicoccus sp. SDUM812002]|uniref:response regulator n=1 Tax=Pelagicoccus sp. SDUM812002 TaxID=3041266 RepID=UPI00280E04E1|nr:response regulator [Pelagicoccus sp. SDUM812002]MDQ8185516.1 response regulator [Pelagicoccus sp. SDUM812002]